MTNEQQQEPLVSVPIPIQIQKSDTTSQQQQQQTRKSSRQFVSIESVDESAMPPDTETSVLAVDKVRQTHIFPKNRVVL